MELVHINDIKEHITELKKLIRVVQVPSHATLVNKNIRQRDFVISKDQKFVEASSEKGLSFTTNMKKLKSLISLNKRYAKEVDIFSIDEFELMDIDGLKIIHDRSGHASLTVTKRMPISDLIKKLEIVADRMEKLGRMRLD